MCTIIVYRQTADFLVCSNKHIFLAGHQDLQVFLMIYFNFFEFIFFEIFF
jgi:hypothetical protein